MSDTPATTPAPTPDLAAAIEGERRLEDRQLVRWPVALTWTTPSGPAAVHGVTINLSFNGGHVAVQHNFALGDRIACRLAVHPWHGNSSIFDLDLVAKVVHSNYSSENDGFDVGLVFESFSGDGKARFAKVMQLLQKGVSPVGAKVIHGMD